MHARLEEVQAEVAELRAEQDALLAVRQAGTSGARSRFLESGSVGVMTTNSSRG